MARPNEGYRKDSQPKRIHNDLIDLMEAFKRFKANDGMKIMADVSSVRVSKEFSRFLEYDILSDFTEGWKIKKELKKIRHERIGKL